MPASTAATQNRSGRRLRVLVVDDSAAFRTQIRHVLSALPSIEHVDTAPNGRIALQKLEQGAFDLVTLDLNMPELDGLDTLRILAERPSRPKTIIFATNTSRSAEDTMTALRLGAWDFVLKPDGQTFSLESALQQVRQQLEPRIATLLDNASGQSVALFANDSSKAPQATPTFPKSIGAIAAKSPTQSFPKVNLETFSPMAIVVASSTGGPAALESLFSALQSPPSVPILIAQHMPETFTTFLAKRLQEMCGVPVREAQSGEAPVPGSILICPGNFHMRLESTSGRVTILLDQGPRLHSVRPAADYLFETAARVYGKHCLGFVLTGMGEDGARGALQIKQTGGGVMIQDKETCVVWGMPAAAHALGAYDRMGPINECARILANAAKR